MVLYRFLICDLFLKMRYTLQGHPVQLSIMKHLSVDTLAKFCPPIYMFIPISDNYALLLT